jgi:hypothetical protein
LRPKPACLLVSVFLMAAATAQELKVYSEFRRIDPYGNIVTPDRGGRVREILSPPAARNSFASFRIAVTPRANTPTWLYIQQNPTVFKVSIYRELYVKAGKEWIPDGLQSVKTPCYLMLPEPPPGIPNQTTQSYWVDLWTPATARVDRVRVEALIKSGEDWIVYPMEVRVAPAVLPPAPGGAAPVLNIAQPLAANAVAVLAKCPVNRAPRSGATVRHHVLRNARQLKAYLDQNPALFQEFETDLNCDFHDRKLFDPEAILNLRQKVFTNRN